MSSAFYATRRLPEVYQDEKYENSREERYANAFGRAFFTPARAVMEKVQGSLRPERAISLVAHYPARALLQRVSSGYGYAS